MQFNPNSSILFILAGAVIVFVIAQSLFFLIRSWRKGKELGIDVSKMKKTVIIKLLSLLFVLVMFVGCSNNQQYADESFLRDAYPYMKKWIKSIVTKNFGIKKFSIVFLQWVNSHQIELFKNMLIRFRMLI